MLLSKSYNITRERLLTVIMKLSDGKSPWRDMMVGYWNKKLTDYRKPLTNLFKREQGKENTDGYTDRSYL